MWEESKNKKEKDRISMQGIIQWLNHLLNVVLHSFSSTSLEFRSWGLEQSIARFFPSSIREPFQLIKSIGKQKINTNS